LYALHARPAIVKASVGGLQGYCMIGHRLAAAHKAKQAAGFIAI
jgi:hypothetical protein